MNNMTNINNDDDNHHNHHHTLDDENEVSKTREDLVRYMQESEDEFGEEKVKIRDIGLVDNGDEPMEKEEEEKQTQQVPLINLGLIGHDLDTKHNSQALQLSEEVKRVKAEYKELQDKYQEETRTLKNRITEMSLNMGIEGKKSLIQIKMDEEIQIKNYNETMSKQVKKWKNK